VPADLLDHKLLFVSGKGGVGKSTVAAALALLGSQRGKRTLACEIDAKGNLADFFEAGPTDYTPREVQPNLFAMSMDAEASLQEYLRGQLIELARRPDAGSLMAVVRERKARTGTTLAPERILAHRDAERR